MEENNSKRIIIITPQFTFLLSMSSTNLWILFILAFQMAKNIKTIETSSSSALTTSTTHTFVKLESINPTEDDTKLEESQQKQKQHTTYITDNRHMDENVFANASPSTKCGGVLTEQRGIITSPNFPNKFPVPITCVWIIDGSMVPLTANISIIIYLTQLYAMSGLKFTEYMYYSEDYKVPSQNIIELREENVTNVAWLKFSSPYLEIKFTMDNLYGTHLRVLDRLLNVFGFNVTYEIEIDKVKSSTCNTKQCSFLGHCYATVDYS